MAAVKWIGAFLGGLNGGVLGALAGYAIGSFVESLFSSEGDVPETEHIEEAGDRNGFLFSLMVLSSHIIQADGKIMHSEMEHVRQFIRVNFGEAAVEQANTIMLRLFEYRKNNGEHSWQEQISQACQDIRMHMLEEHRMQLLVFLVEISKADGNVDKTEIDALYSLSAKLGFGPQLIDQMLSLGGASLDDAYASLGLSPDCSDDDVRKAYRKMALQYHPDRVSTLGEDVKEAAKKKFQEINDAKERIYKARGIK